jgi:branched-chain amino acid transport system ATP-binding protein
VTNLVLDVRDLEVRYGRIEAVRGVSLNVGPGEVVGLLGPNGAGKSSVLAAITGVVKARGRIALGDKSLSGLDPEQIARSGLSIVPEGRRLFARLSVSENLKLGATSRRDGRSAVEADLRKLAERFPVLKQRWHDPAAKLSGGQQQQLAIARALLARPRLLLMDEPSLGLDPMTVRRVFEIVAELKAEGQSILLAEQNAVRTAEVADRVYVLRTGTVARTGSGVEMRRDIDYKAEYLGVERQS